MLINKEADHWKKWETWADWNDCGSSWCNHPDCAYHRYPEERKLKNSDPEECFDGFEPPVCREDPDTFTELDEDYYPDDDFEEVYCPGCGEDGSTVYWRSPAGYGVCKCSPFYPDLRPGDLPWISRFRACFCERKYRVTGCVICKCNSPDLYALMERLHELGLIDNFELVFPDQIDGDTPLIEISKDKPT